MAGGRSVLIGIMDTPISDRNPWTVQERRAMFRERFAKEIGEGRLSLIDMPWIDQVIHGRACGWEVRHIDLPEEYKAITGTAIRERMAANV